MKFRNDLLRCDLLFTYTLLACTPPCSSASQSFLCIETAKENGGGCREAATPTRTTHPHRGTQSTDSQQEVSRHSHWEPFSKGARSPTAGSRENQVTEPKVAFSFLILNLQKWIPVYLGGGWFKMRAYYHFTVDASIKLLWSTLNLLCQ